MEFLMLLKRVISMRRYWGLFAAASTFVFFSVWHTTALAQNVNRQEVLGAYRQARAQGTLGKGGMRALLERRGAGGLSAASGGLLRSPGLQNRKEKSAVDPRAWEHVEKKLDIAYGPAALEKLDLYTPKHSNNQRMPILIFFHGGGWRMGDKRQHDGKGALYARNEIIFVNADYGLAPQVVHPAQAFDVAKAIKYSIDHAIEWGGDPERIYLMGHSAGAHLVDLVATNQRFLKEVGVNPLNIKGVISLDTASLDLLQRSKEDSFEGQHVGKMIEQAFGKDPAMLKDGSPTLNIHKGVAYPKFLMICGERRRSAMKNHDEFVRQLRNAGGQVVVKPVPLSHRDINLAAGDGSSDIFKWTKSFVTSGSL